MDLRAERILEFDKVKELLAQRASFSLGKELCYKLRPSVEPEIVSLRQRATTETRLVLSKHGGAPFGGISDISHILRKAKVGSVLLISEFVELRSNLYGIGRMRQFISSKAVDCPLILEQGHRIADFRRLEADLAKAISDEGEVMDSASPELSRIRSQMRITQNKIRDKLESIIRSSEFSKILQNPIVTIRNGRYVVPVKAEQKGNFVGIVHDQSGSGQTVFIEPQAVVDMNNQLRGLESAEQEEIQRILRLLTEKVSERYAELDEALAALGQLDLMFAKGRMAEETKAVSPILNQKGYIKIYDGRHPLLKGDVVPTNVWLGDEFSMLLITGPNTGGKTVTLKTIGLLTLMSQAGLHVPADDGTELAIFNSIYADIGDEQSIEQSLSTFSSHMTQIVKIIESADSNSLVLLDELGAGTDPTEGAALAIGILQDLHSRGCRVVATTHYSELKTFAYTSDGVENASVEFDVNTLQPTYKLSIGLPGRSNAFAIAKRLGLTSRVIDTAKATLTQDHMRVEDLIREIEESKRQALRDRSESARLKNEVDKLRKEYEEKLRLLTTERDTIFEAARREAESLLAEARKEADRLLGELRKAGSTTDLESTAKSVRTELDTHREKLDKSKEKEQIKSKVRGPKDLKPGEMVRLLKLNQTGQVIEVKGSEVLVQAGILRVTVPVSEVERADDKPVQVERTRRNSSMGHEKAMHAKSELHLRGMRVVDGLALLDKFLDDAILSGLSSVRIVHGKGTGTMRRAVQEALKQHPYVESHRLGGPGEGSYGVTVVDLKRK